MYRKNPELRSSKDEVVLTEYQVRELNKCANDIKHFATYFKILTPQGYQPCKLRKYQETVLNDICDPNAHNNIIMMHRQSGKTVLAAIYALHYAMFNRDKCVGIMANKEVMAEDILHIIREAYRQLPIWLQVGLDLRQDAWSKRRVYFANGSYIFAAPALSSAVRGRTLDLAIVDEFAHFDERTASDFMASIFPTLTTRPASKTILMSTPYGMNHFYQIWQKAVQGLNSFKATKVNIYDDERYTPDDIERLKLNFGNIFIQQEYNCKFYQPNNESPKEKKKKIVDQITTLLHELIEIEE